MTYVPGKGPSYRDIFGEPPEDGEVPTAKEEGIIGPVPGMFGSIQAMEAIKYITGVGELLTGYMLVCDLYDMSVRKVKLPPVK